MPRTAKKKSVAARPSQDIFDLIGKGDNIREASAAMQAMGHPLRLKILCLVGNQELSVLEIVDAVGTTQSNISQHLGVLREHGLLVARKEANKVFYRIDDPRVLKMIALTREIFCSF
ncbi:MAG TPA: metalloregulator ArsR/SmtB family transcription factor [Usitatibacter sp.]|nr:metalloregulator ArsR/SmtB family transcription factor [Usitatibacter sp.]